MHSRLASYFIVLLLSVLFIFILPSNAHAQTQPTFWKYQCIDTMKESRDNARSAINDPNIDTHIAWEMKIIKSLGANCVAIATPYDAEFLPYLTKWVKAARKEKLHVWFRGNFSGWEGWFGYPKITSTEDELTRLRTFITSQPQLFADGDIFTGTPEAENGGPFGQITPAQYPAYRQFLIDQNNVEQKAFNENNKHVITNWFSMNGDIARNMYDQPTLTAIGNLVTVDHYIKQPTDMSDIITFFKSTHNSNFVLGEFGAPVPDLNGQMTEDQQANFVDKVFQELYQKRDTVLGINYWDFYDGSTALMNNDQTPRKVTQIIKKYFDPAIVKGKVTNERGVPIANIGIQTDNALSVKTDTNGNYSFPTLATNMTLAASNEGTVITASLSGMKTGQIYEKNFTLRKYHESIPQKIQDFLRIFLK